MKKVFLYITIGIALLAIPATVYLIGQNQDIRKRASPASTLSFSPPSTTVKAGDRFTLYVKLDTAANQVGLVQLRVVYDPVYLTVEDITNDIFAPSIRVSKKIDPNGKVSISVGAKDNTHPINGSGTIAVISMKALKSSATPLPVKFTPSPDTVANALNETATDVLIGRSPASITILNEDGSASSTTTAIATLTPSPTPRASLTPTPLSGGSALMITSLTENETVTDETPEIRGKGVPGSSVTIIVHSTGQQTAIVSVDANGNWVYTPTIPLEPGNHTVEAMMTDPNTGATQSDMAAFVVASGNESVDASSGSAIPVSGSATITGILMTLGIILLLSGITVPLLLQ